MSFGILKSTHARVFPEPSHTCIMYNIRRLHMPVSNRVFTRHNAFFYLTSNVCLYTSEGVKGIEREESLYLWARTLMPMPFFLTLITPGPVHRHPKTKTRSYRGVRRLFEGTVSGVSLFLRWMHSYTSTPFFFSSLHFALI